MFIQKAGSRHIVYVPNHVTDYMLVADEFGMIEDGHIASYVEMSNEAYVNPFGISIPAVRLNGRTVDLYVVDDTVAAKSTRAQDVQVALNTFLPDSKINISGYDFVSKFSWYESYSHSITDSAKRVFSLRTYGRKDLRGIYNMMVSLGDNNGKLYEPVIARFVYTSYQMPRHRQLVGYFDLGEYMAIIKDSRYEELFMTLGRSNALAFVELKETPPSVKIVGVINNCAQLRFTNIEGTYDAKKLKEFKPYVVLTRRPLTIKNMKFPWTRVKFDKVEVFMTPIMSLSDAWESLEGGINLLAPATGNDKNLRF